MNAARSANFVRQLRAVAPSDPVWACAQNCADEIERLQAEIQALRHDNERLMRIAVAELNP